MNTPEPTAAARRAQENLVRKQAAGRLGAALMMVTMSFGLLVFGAVMAGVYIEDRHWYQGPRWNGFKRDAMYFVEEPLLAIMILHVVLVLSAWYFGRMAGIHVFYRGKRTFGVSAACTYASIWPALILGSVL